MALPSTHIDTGRDSFPWSDEEVAFCGRKYTQGMPITALARVLHRRVPTVERKIANMKLCGLRDPVIRPCVLATDRGVLIGSAYVKPPSQPTEDTLEVQRLLLGPRPSSMWAYLTTVTKGLISSIRAASRSSQSQ